MPGKRSDGQTLIGCWCEASLIEKIDAARGGLSRSQYARDAITEKLHRTGVSVTAREQFAPDRKGKGRPVSSKSPAVAAALDSILDAAIDKARSAGKKTTSGV